MLAAKLEEILIMPIETLGYELVGIEYFPQGKGYLLRVYVDKNGGVNIEDCRRVSREIDSILMVEDPIPGQYTLEVSSPGLDRPLFKLADFALFIGKEVDIKLFELNNGRRHFKAVIENVVSDEITIKCDNEIYTLKFSEIKSARLIPQFN